MKSSYIILTFIGFFLFLSIGYSVSYDSPTDEIIIDETPITIIEEIPETKIKDLEDFLMDLGLRESSGRYNIVNSYGYLGKYQFSPALLWKLGFKVTRDEFLANPQLQRDAMVALLEHNKDILSDVITRFDGEIFDEVIKTDSTTYIETYTVTKSGILAAAHLIGPYRTRLFLEDRIESKDGYGTNVTEYLYAFSGYTLNL